MRLTTGDQRLKTAAAMLVCVLVAQGAEASLTAADRLAAVYDLILDARFDSVDQQLAAACPPAPVEACQTMRPVSLWWQIQINPESRLLDQRFAELAASAIAANQAWTRREPQRAEAWFYLAGSYAPVVQWHVLRGERLAAARDGKKIKDALERTLQLDPTLNDAYFGIGLYHYYAAVAPMAAKILRWLLWLPGGDRAQGLEEMMRARDRGEILRGEADYQLQVVYVWYEQRVQEALQLLARLNARYPTNPLFQQRIAEIYDGYLHDHEASARAWRELLDRARAGRVYDARTTEVRARLGLASELAALHRTDAAIDQLQIVIDMHPLTPIGAAARAEQQLRAVRAQTSKR